MRHLVFEMCKLLWSFILHIYTQYSTRTQTTRTVQQFWIILGFAQRAANSISNDLHVGSSLYEASVGTFQIS